MFSTADWFRAHLAVCVILLFLHFFSAHFVKLLQDCSTMFTDTLSLLWYLILGTWYLIKYCSVLDTQSLLWNLKIFGICKFWGSFMAGLNWQFQMWILSLIWIINLTFCCFFRTSFLWVLFFQITFFFFSNQSKLVLWWCLSRKETAHRMHTTTTSSMACETTEARDTVNSLGGRSGS